MADIPRLNGAIRALEQGKPAFTAFAAPEINTSQALGAAAYDGVGSSTYHAVQGRAAVVIPLQ